MQTKSVLHGIKAVGDEGVVEGYAAVYGNKDLDGDIIEPGAVELMDKPRVLWQHRWDSPIGTIENSTNDEKGLFVRARLAVDTVAKAREAFEMVKAGLVDSFSIGYIPREWSWNDVGERLLKKVDVFEVSLVTFPANPEAVVTGVKAVPPMSDWPLASRSHPWDAQAAIRRVREKLGATEQPTRDYRKCFFWYDAEAADNFGAYKLPYCDVIDDRIHAIPRAIFAAAAVLEGARGGIDIPSDDKERVRRLISRWYRRMAEDFDDPQLVAPWDRDKGRFPTLEEVKAVYSDAIQEEIDAAIALTKLSQRLKSFEL